MCGDIDRLYYCPRCTGQVGEFIWLFEGKYYCSLECVRGKR